MDVKEHAQKTISGLKWSGLSQFSLQMLNLVLNIILARLLGPYEFGVLAMIAVFVGFLQLFKDFGFGAILISSKDVDDLDFSTVFWTNLGLGVFLTSMLYFSSSWISDFYNEPILESLIDVVSLMFIIQAFNFVQVIKLTKKLEYKKLAIVNVLSILISGSIGILCAFNGLGVWSLIIKDISQALVYLILIWKFASWRPSFQFSFIRFKYFLNSGLALIGTKSLNYFARSLDNILIGKFIGAPELGVYNRAYSFMTFPIYKITGVLSSVLFPSFSIIQGNINRIIDMFLKSVQITSFVIFMLMGLLYINATEFVMLVLGVQWKSLIPLLKILALPSALQSITLLTENIFRAQNKYQLEFKLNIVVSVILVIAIIIGLEWGIIGVAYSYLCAVILTTVIILIVTAKIVKINVFKILKNIYPSLLGFLILVIIKSIFMYYNSAYEINIWFKFISQIILGACIYTSVVFIVNRNILYNTKSIVRKFKN
ncbi:lipopolysaccharide biosynthesis protein [Aequorivita viscosa]|nr:lipopolysaccharide biosynthesis protein [Aequorivita viscosa]